MFSAPDSFCYKKFFRLCGLSSKTPKEIKDVFQILDEDNSGYIEESELKCVRQAWKVHILNLQTFVLLFVVSYRA